MRERSETHRRPPVQRKMTVGPADDRYEREADRVAERVVAQLATEGPAAATSPEVARDLDEDELKTKRARRAANGEALQRAGNDDEALNMKPLPLQRQPIGPEGGDLDADTSARIDASRSGGRPLDPPLRRSMEGAFGADFSSVRVHSGGSADRLNADLGARAFTTGSDVFVRSSDYKPDTHAGRELLAHELTHVVQQGAAPDLETS